MLRMNRNPKESEDRENRSPAAEPSSVREDSPFALASPEIRMRSTWQKSDWQQFYQLARRPWRRHRPPRPVYPSGRNRVAPAQGFSLSELYNAGVDLDLA